MVGNSGCGVGNSMAGGTLACPAGFTASLQAMVNALSACTGTQDQQFFYVCN